MKRLLFIAASVLCVCTFAPGEAAFGHGAAAAVYPELDIKCNGLDTDVEISDGEAVKLTIDIAAHDFAGYPCEVWILGINKTTGAVHTYGPHPNAFWFPGAGNCFYTGGLSDYSGVVLDQPLSIGDYVCCLAIDLCVNGSIDPATIWDLDTVDFRIVPLPSEYAWDDGSTEGMMSFVSGGDLVGMHRFDVIPGGENITEVGTIFGSLMAPGIAPGNGSDTEFFIWEDPTADMDPTDCVLIHSQLCQVANVDTDVHAWYTCDNGPIKVNTTDFWIGFRLVHDPAQWCLSLDHTTPYVPGNAYYTGCVGTKWGFKAADLTDPINYPPDETPYGFWTVRARY